jgi:uncharacterized protein (TIGR03435 family)
MTPLYLAAENGCMDAMMRGGPGTHDPRTLTFPAMRPIDLLALAYGVDPTQILGLDRSGPDWDGTRLYKVTAALPSGTTKEEIAPIFQQMLATRFDLEAHRETLPLKVYEASVAGSAPKIQEALWRGGRVNIVPRNDVGSPQPSSGCLTTNALNGQMQVGARDMGVRYLTGLLSGLLGRPVLDRTALPGKYTFDFRYPLEGLAGPLGMAERRSATDSGATGLIAAVQTQLGLSLVEKTIPFDAVIVDHIDEVPANFCTFNHAVQYCMLPLLPRTAAVLSKGPDSAASIWKRPSK